MREEEDTHRLTGGQGVEREGACHSSALRPTARVGHRQTEPHLPSPRTAWEKEDRDLPTTDLFS